MALADQVVLEKTSPEIDNDTHKLTCSFSITQEILESFLFTVNSVVDKRSPIPLLSNIKISVNEDNLSIVATNMDIFIKKDNIPATIHSTGEFTISANLIYDIVRKLSKGTEITIKVENNKATISALYSKFILATISADNFPQTTDHQYDQEFQIVSKDLLRLLDKVKFAMSSDEIRYYLNGVYFTIKEGKLISAATDGHRLASLEIIDTKLEDSTGVIIPKKSVLEIIKLLINGSEEDDLITIKLSSQKIYIIVHNTTLISKLTDGNFPDYQATIPKENQYSILLNVNNIKTIIERVTIISHDRTRIIRLAISGDVIEISSSCSEQLHNAQEITHAESGSVTPNSMNIGLNARYMLDVLNTIDGEFIEILITDPIKPIQIIDTEYKDSKSNPIFIVMPMRI